MRLLSALLAAAGRRGGGGGAASLLDQVRGRGTPGAWPRAGHSPHARVPEHQRRVGVAREGREAMQFLALFGLSRAAPLPSPSWCSGCGAA